MLLAALPRQPCNLAESRDSGRMADGRMPGVCIRAGVCVCSHQCTQRRVSRVLPNAARCIGRRTGPLTFIDPFAPRRPRCLHARTAQPHGLLLRMAGVEAEWHCRGAKHTTASAGGESWPRSYTAQGTRGQLRANGAPACRECKLEPSVCLAVVLRRWADTKVPLDLGR